jgi:hypothetical protein
MKGVKTGISDLAVIVALLGATGTMVADSTGCTKTTGPAVVATIAQIAVDTCQEAPSLLPPGASGVVSLVCSLYDNNEQTVQVLIDQTLWGNMKAAYLAQHGSLPAGMHLDPAK